MADLPKDYLAAFREADALFDAGTLTSEAFDPLWDRAAKALDGNPLSGELLEGMMLIAPQDWVERNQDPE